MPLVKHILPEERRPRLGALLEAGQPIRAIECHNPLSAMLGAAAESRTGRRFDALWVSGFANATALGLPDAELNLLERKLGGVVDIAAVTDLPLIVDADTGGDALAFSRTCLRLEASGVSAIVVEDKAGEKRTSLAEGVAHQMEDPDRFVAKIAVARTAMRSADTLIFARTEALIAGLGVDEAVRRAEIYLRGAPDGLVVHSKDKSGAEVRAFLVAYRELQARVGIAKPLMLIPTAYHHIGGQELIEAGASIIVHGNHMIRAAFKAMSEAASLILENDRSLEADAVCAPVTSLFDAVGVELAP
jgi:phosphoenolpyruvate phosphomutase